MGKGEQMMDSEEAHMVGLRTGVSSKLGTSALRTVSRWCSTNGRPGTREIVEAVAVANSGHLSRQPPLRSACGLRKELSLLSTNTRK
jgi:hypothetical protein